MAKLEKLYNDLGNIYGKAPYSVEKFKEYATDSAFLGNLYDNIGSSGRINMGDMSRDQFIKKFMEADDRIPNREEITGLPEEYGYSGVGIERMQEASQQAEEQARMMMPKKDNTTYPYMPESFTGGQYDYGQIAPGVEDKQPVEPAKPITQQDVENLGRTIDQSISAAESVQQPNKDISSQYKRQFTKGFEERAIDAQNRWLEDSLGRFEDQLSTIENDIKGQVDAGTKKESTINPLVQGILREENVIIPGEEGPNTTQSTTLRLLSQARDVIDMYKRKDKSGLSNFFDAFGRSVDTGMLTLGISDAIDLLKVLSVANKINASEDGFEKLTKDEKQLITAYSLLDQLQNSLQLSNSQRWGQGSADSLGFMLSFAATGGLGSAASKGVTKGVEIAAKKIIKNTARNVVNKATQRGVGKAVRNVATTAGKMAVEGIVGGLTTTLTGGLGYTAAEIERRLIGTPSAEVGYDGTYKFNGITGQETLGGAIVKGLANQAIENGTEYLGSYIGLNAGKLFSKFPGATRLLTKPIPKKFSKTMNRIARLSGFNGFIPEVAEEEIGMILNAATLGETKWEDITDLQNQLDILVQVGIISGGFQIANFSSTGYHYNKYREARRQYEAIDYGKGSRIEDIDSLLENTPIDQRTDVIEAIANSYNFDNADKAKLANYVMRKTNYDFILGEIQERAQQAGDEAAKNEMRFINEAMGGKVYVTLSDGRTAVVTSGQLSTEKGEDGLYSTANGSDSVVVIPTDVEGAKPMLVSMKDIANIDAITPTEQALQEARAAAESLQTETDATTIETEAAEETQTEGGNTQAPQINDTEQAPMYKENDEVIYTDSMGQQQEGTIKNVQPDGVNIVSVVNGIPQEDFVPFENVQPKQVQQGETEAEDTTGTAQPAQTEETEPSVAETQPAVEETQPAVEEEQPGTDRWAQYRKPNGEVDTKKMTFQEQMEYGEENLGVDEMVSLAKNGVNATQKQIDKLQKQYDSEIDPGKKVSKKKQLDALQERLKAYQDYLDANDENRQSTAQTPQNLIGRLNALGDIRSLRDFILREIASGNAKFKWADSESGTKGLASHLGIKKSPKERRMRISLLSNSGYTPEEFAHYIWERQDAQNSDLPFRGYETDEILDEVIDVLQSVYSPKQALEQAEEVRDKEMQQPQEEPRVEQQQEEAESTEEQQIEPTEETEPINEELPFERPTDDYVPFRQENEQQNEIEGRQVGQVTFTQEEIKDYINEEAGKLNIPIRIIENVEDIAPEEHRYREKRRSKGWFDVNTGEIVIVAPNHTSIRDAQKTILHEAVAHYGLRGLIGTENFDELCDRTWAEMTDSDRIYFAAYAEGKNIDSLTQEDIDTFTSYDYADKRIAADEYLASVAENGIAEPTIWQKIKEAIKDLFNKIGINLQIDDADIAYMLWKSKNRITDRDSTTDVIRKSAADTRIKESLDERFRIERKENLNLEEAKILSNSINEILTGDNVSESMAFEAIRKLGLLNGSAYKGYGALTKEQLDYNNFVYDKKNDLLKKAVELYKKNNWDISKSPYVVYFRSPEGIQVSFHTSGPMSFLTPNEDIDLSGVPNGEWDGVIRSYLYNNVSDYEDARQRSKNDYEKFLAEKKAYSDRAKDIAIKYLKHPARRKRFGIKDDYSKLVDKIKISRYISDVIPGFDATNEITREIERVIGKRNTSDYQPKDYSSDYPDNGIRFRTSEYTQEEKEIIDKAKQNGTYLKAPNGKDTNLTPKQWAQVRTKAFKDWFGDWENDPETASKVVDENGEPKVVFHGTPLRRDQITPNKGWQKDGTYINQEAPFYTFRGGEYSGMIFTSVDAEKARSIAENGITEPTVWQKIKEAIKDLFNKIGIDLQIDDADIAYMLWKSKNRITDNDDMQTVVEKSAADDKMRKDIDERFRGINSGYTQREDGTNISVNAFDAEQDGTFTEGTFRKVYGVSKNDFNILSMLGIVKYSEWHHTGANFTRSRFYSWGDSDRVVDNGYSYANSSVQDGSFAQIYRDNKNQIGKLVKELDAKNWEYETGQEEANKNTEGKEKTLLEIASIFGLEDADKVVNYQSRENRRKIQEDAVIKEFEEKRKQLDVEQDKRKKSLDKWLQSNKEKGNITEYSRIPAGTEPKFFVETEREITGAYDWYNNKPMDDSPVYVSGIAFKSKLLYDSYINKKKEIKDAYLNFENEYSDAWRNIRFRVGEEYTQEEQEIIDKAKQAGTYLKSPNGKDTNLTPKQWAQVRTKAFKDWFGDWENEPENSSKVVDDNGEPMVVYHGSPNEFTIFDTSKIGSSTGTSDGRGFYFTTRKSYAESFATQEGNLFEVFLDIRNPLSYDKKTITKAQLKKIFRSIDKSEYEREGEHYTLSNYADYTKVGIENTIAEAVNLEYESADNDVELINSIIAGSGDFGLVMNAVRGVTGKSSMIAPKENGDIHYIVTFPNQIKSATDNVGTFSEDNPDIRFRIREQEPPKNTGIGYKVFVLKNGKLYPPMVANPGGEETPVGVWLDADAAPISGQSKTGRKQVKAGGKGTQGGSGKLAYRPGWHLGEIPYAIQFNRKNPITGEKELFPKNFVWAEVEYANDVDYQKEAYSYGINSNGKYQHSLAGLPYLPINGSYKYRTNPNPETDPWIITGSMRVNRLLTPSEVDKIVNEAGRNAQQREEGYITDDEINELNKKLGLSSIRFRINGFLDNSGVLFRFIGEKGAFNLDAAEEATTRIDNLQTAREMEKSGRSAKSIKLATGWERGIDGLWRYETMDSDKIDLYGNVEWIKNHPKYKRMYDLRKKEISYLISDTNPLTEKEKEEYDKLKSELDDVSYEMQKNPDSLTLKDIIDDKTLFEAYPNLAEIKVKITDMDIDNPASVIETGSLLSDEKVKLLLLNKEIYKKASEIFNIEYQNLLKSSIEHEIQHLIQYEEGFAHGGSPKSILKQLDNLIYSMNGDVELSRQLNSQREELVDALYKLDRSSKWFKNPKSFLKSSESFETNLFDSRIDEGQKIADEYYWDAINIILNGFYDRYIGRNASADFNLPENTENLSKKGWKKEEAKKLLNEYLKAVNKEISKTFDKDKLKEYQRLIKKRDEQSDFELYESIAGEVEARNVQTRLGMPIQERLNSLAEETEDVAREDQIVLQNMFVLSDEYDIRFRSSRRNREREVIEIYDIDHKGIADGVKKFAEENLEPGTYDFFTARTGSIYMNAKIGGSNVEVRMANHTKAMRYDQSPHLLGDGFSIDFYKDGSVNVSMDIVQNGMTDVEINQFLKGLKEYEDSPIKERVMLLLEGADTVYPNIAEGEIANQLYAMVGEKFVETLNSTIRENHHYALNQEVKKQEDIMQKSQSNIRFTIGNALKDDVFHWYATTSDRMLYDISGGYWFNATNGYLKITPNILEGSIFFDPQSIEKKLVSAYFVPARGVNKRKAKKEAIQEYVSDYVTTLSNAPIYDSDKIIEGGSNIVQARYNIDQIKQEYNIWHSAKFGYPAPDVITRFRRIDMPDVSTIVTENNGVYEVNLQNLLPEEEGRVRELAKSMSDVTITGDIVKFPDRDMAENAVRNAMMFYGDLSDEITNIPYDVTPLDVMEKLDQRIKRGKLKRIWIDQYQPLKALGTMIEKKLGITIPENLDAWEATGYMDSQAAAQLDEYKARYYEPLLELYVKLSSGAGVSEKELTDYLLIKHGIERNQVFRAEELKEWEDREQEAIKNKNLKTQAQKDAAQQDYEKRRAEYIEQLRQKDYSGYYEYFTNELSKKYDTPEDFISYVENTIGSDMTASIWDKIRAATNRTLDIAYNAGNISKESRDYYKSRFMYYVPLRGFEGDTMDETYSSRYKIGGRSSIDKRAKGRASMADNPLVYIATMAATEIDRAAKNDMKKILLRLLNSSNVKGAFSGHYVIEKSDGSTEKVTKLPKNKSGITRITHVPGVYQISRKYQYLMFDENGMPMLDSNGNQMWEDRDEEPTPEELANGLARLSYNPKAPKSTVIKTPAQQDESSVSVYINGEEIKITFTNPDLARSVNGQLNPDSRSEYLQKISQLTRYMANNYTTLSPAFVFVTNFARDAQTSFLNNLIEHGGKSAVNTVGNYKPAFLAMRRYIFKEGIKKRPTDSEISIALNKIKNGNRMTNHDYDVLAYLFISRGGETGYIGMQNVDKYRKEMQDLMKYSDKKTIEVKGELKKRNLMRRGVKFMGDTARLMEDITRFSQFLQALKQGDSVSKAATKAKNISTNFNRRGSHEGVNWVFAHYAFLNATLQGTYRQWQIAKAHPYRTAGITVMFPFLMGVAEAVAGYFWGGDDDDFGKKYYELSEFKRHNYMCLPTIFSDNFITIPLPQIYRTFHALGCMVVDQIYNKSNPITTKDITTVDLFTTAAQDIMPLQYGSVTNIIPTVYQPIATILLNKTFTGAPLYKDTPYNQNTPEYRKAYGNASNIFVAASEMINDITGGNYAEKGWFEKLPFIGKLNNPAVMQQLALSYLPGLPRVATQFTIAGESAVRKTRETEEDFSISEVPIAGTLIGDPTDRIPRSVIRSHWYNFTDKAREIKRVDRELLTNMFIDEFAENQNAENIIPAETYSKVADIVLKLLQDDKENRQLENKLQNGLIPADQIPRVRAQFEEQSRETDKTIKELLEGLYNAGIDIKSK